MNEKKQDKILWRAFNHTAPAPDTVAVLKTFRSLEQT
jgi:hypothetical protein